jgi:NitT/TauT family transport system substrate-binding protein
VVIAKIDTQSSDRHAGVMTNMDMLTIPAAAGVDSTALIVGDFSSRGNPS